MPRASATGRYATPIDEPMKRHRASQDTSAEDAISVILGRYPEPVRWLVGELRTMIQETLPEATQRAYPGWQAVGFRHPAAGYLCGIFPFEDRVQLVFEHGAQLGDPDRLLSVADLKQTRFVLLRPGKRIPGAGLRRLLLAALHHGATGPSAPGRSRAAHPR